MLRNRIFQILLISLTLFAVGCSPEAKKQKALDGGNRYFEKGQYKQARLMYLNAIKVDPRFGEAYYKLALTNMRLGAYAESVGNLQRTIELQPGNLDAHSRLSEILLSVYAGNPTKNKNVLTDIRDLSAKMDKVDKDSYEALRLRGYLALADNRAEDSLKLFDAADKKKPDQPALLITKARVLLSLNRREEMKAVLEQILSKNPAYGTAYDLLYATAIYEKRVEDAEKIMKRRIVAEPKVSAHQLRLAAHYQLSRQPEKAEEVLKGMLAKRSDFPDAFQEVGDFYFRLRNYETAVKTYEEGAKQDPERQAMYLKRVVEVRVAQDRAPEALQLVESILAKDKTDPEAIAMRASLWLFAGKPEQNNAAIAELQSVVTKMPENFVLRYNLGRALLAKGDLDGARVQFNDALRLRPDYTAARVALANLLVIRGEHAAAMTAANEILQADPANQFARLIRANALLAQKRYKESEEALNETLKLNPNHKDAKYYLGYVKFQEGNLKEAEQLFQSIVAQNPPDIRGLYGLTEIYSAQKQYDRALKMLDESIQKFPKAKTLEIAWSNIAIRAGRFDDGIARLSKILAEDPKNFEMNMRLGEYYRQKGDLNKALDIWKSAADLRPNAIQPPLFRAMALGQLNRPNEAAPLYEQVLKVQPDNVMALNNYSYILATQGNDLDLALTYAQRARSKAPTDPMVADTLGFVYLKKNLPDNAASIFSELTSKYPTVAIFHIRLATAYLQAGDKAKAKKELDDARTRNPNEKDRAEIEKLAARLG